MHRIVRVAWTIANTRKALKVVNICGSNVDAMPKKVKRRRRQGNGRVTMPGSHDALCLTSARHVLSVNILREVEMPKQECVRPWCEGIFV